ncbi:MAG TPA: hypothetical protein VGM39_07205 [Kofleriaceae bacterium]|jgi:hypothetical protein
MCCFSGPVEDVAATRIFARFVAPGRQVIAYEMQFTAAEPVAMILPIPTPPNSAEDAVWFISLETYPTLFEELYEAFTFPHGRPRGLTKSLPLPQQHLKVEVVGAFVASFVPTLSDFSRLDPRFRLPAGTLDRVPEYQDYGFVVFQLGAAKTPTRVHPMAFEFSTRDPENLFFPTLHVHDGTVHPEAVFDHVLYAQGVRGDASFQHGQQPLSQRIHHPEATLVLDLAQQLARREMIGTFANADRWAPAFTNPA